MNQHRGCMYCENILLGYMPAINDSCMAAERKQERNGNSEGYV